MTSSVKGVPRSYDNTGRARSSRSRQLRVAQVAAELLVERGYAGTTMADVAMVHVPYKGAPAALPDIIAGNVTCMFVAVPAALSLIKAGRLRALAVSGATRVPALPEVRTVNEAGLKGFDAVAWHGLFATGGTPPEIVQRLNAEVTAILAQPALRGKMQDQGLEVATSTPAELGRRVVVDRERWGEVVRRSGAKLD